jgi:hypothetical protein
MLAVVVAAAAVTAVRSSAASPRYWKHVARFVVAQNFKWWSAHREA